ncbi:MAG: tRNA preQ1(34) S-adenosylmethionine ribosyltransferase-isomerase QueA [Myxococcales bacterium]|nr:tRNA preQ1(34) S-adenosylmethionine ribosyltransferase-isomerase QueA [Myxococcales bacterium]
MVPDPPAPTDLSAWSYDLPPDRIARFPTEARDGARLMVLGRDRLDHRAVVDLPDLLAPGDLLVVNDTRVMAARLPGRRRTGARLEILALAPGPGPVPCMIRNARRLDEGEVIEVAGREAVLVRRLPDGLFEVDIPDLPTVMEEAGSLPLPPYLEREAGPADAERYQTVFAGPLGAAAAPTAGLHFSPALLARLEARGVEVASVTLHVGIGTFRPLREEDVERGELHPEPWTVPEATRDAVIRTRARGGRVIAVGTTSTRALESATPEGSRVPDARSGTTRLFIHPGRPIRTVDGLFTNFHLPRSSLLMLVATFLDRERLLHAYRTAVDEGYRFYSYGDAMLVLP